MRTLLAFALIAILAGPAAAKAGPDSPGNFVKNGYPCFAEVCLGDRIEDLVALPWETVPMLERSNNVADTRSRASFPDAHRAVYGWWNDDLMRTVYQGMFDSRFIPMASNYALSCPDDGRRATHQHLSNVRRLTGIYTTDSGLTTEVDVVLAPDTLDPERKTVYTVASIRRSVPAADAGEAQRISQIAKARYEGVPGVRVTTLSDLVTIHFNISSTPSGATATDRAWRELAQAPRCTTPTTRGID